MVILVILNGEYVYQVNSTKSNMVIYSIIRPYIVDNEDVTIFRHHSNQGTLIAGYKKQAKSLYE